ncbi:MAG: DUF6470 family protein [Oscillospiraceae bacterium]|jgi:hypothetical protein
MDQLLSIKTIPISVEIVMQNAQLKYNNELPKVKVSRQQGGYVMQADPIKINIDMYKTRQSLGMKSNDILIDDFATEGIKIAYQATAKYVDKGNNYADPQGMSVGKFEARSIQKSINTVLEFIPKERPEISWNGGTLNIQYQMDEMNMDWDVHSLANFEFIPGKVEFEIKQRPMVDIEYIGGPIYIPPSANPDYVGKEIDVRI